MLSRDESYQVLIQLIKSQNLESLTLFFKTYPHVMEQIYKHVMNPFSGPIEIEHALLCAFQTNNIPLIKLLVQHAPIEWYNVKLKLSGRISPIDYFNTSQPTELRNPLFYEIILSDLLRHNPCRKTRDILCRDTFMEFLSSHLILDITEKNYTYLLKLIVAIEKKFNLSLELGWYRKEIGNRALHYLILAQDPLSLYYFMQLQNSRKNLFVKNKDGLTPLELLESFPDSEMKKSCYQILLQDSSQKKNTTDSLQATQTKLGLFFKQFQQNQHIPLPLLKKIGQLSCPDWLTPQHRNKLVNYYIQYFHSNTSAQRDQKNALDTITSFIDNAKQIVNKSSIFYRKKWGEQLNQALLPLETILNQSIEILPLDKKIIQAKQALENFICDHLQSQEKPFPLLRPLMHKTIKTCFTDSSNTLVPVAIESDKHQSKTNFDMNDSLDKEWFEFKSIQDKPKPN